MNSKHGGAITKKGSVLKLLQGYIWHPREEKLELGDYLPVTLEPSLHILWDAMPQAPFTFFDDGTLSATQQFYQFTVLHRSGAASDTESHAEEVGGLIPWLAETLQAKLSATPEGVGWQIFEDLRPV